MFVFGSCLNRVLHCLHACTCMRLAVPRFMHFSPGAIAVLSRSEFLDRARTPIEQAVSREVESSLGVLTLSSKPLVNISN